MSDKTSFQPFFKFSLAALLAAVLWSAWTALPVYAQGPIVTDTEPISNALNVKATTNITVTFDMAIDAATVNTQSLTLRGEQTGIYAGTYSFPSVNTVVFDPVSTFKPGEVLRGNVSSQISSTGAISASPVE
ncbi:MAG: Ig-like domain-containing protein [Chloroflexi bacterium]|nr:Ig-like domain-containing protein [Chloroflexota bacterium]